MEEHYEPFYEVGLYHFNHMDVKPLLAGNCWLAFTCTPLVGVRQQCLYIMPFCMQRARPFAANDM